MSQPHQKAKHAKAFSGKQKKLQLQERRLRKNNKDGGFGDSWSNDDSHFEALHSSPQATENVEENFEGGPAHSRSQKTSKTTGGNFTIGADKSGVRSKFELEKEKEIQDRKRRSFEPLTQRQISKAGAGGGIPFGQWFQMPPNYFKRGGREKEEEKEQKSSDPVDHIDEFPCSVSLPVRGKPTTKQNQCDADEETFQKWLKSVQNLTSIKDENETKIIQENHRITVIVDRSPEENSARMELTQYERNLEVWQQLWRTVERSDVMLVIADSRFPLFHLPVSLFHFLIKENNKPVVIVLNKVDLIPRSVLDGWKEVITDYLAPLFGKIPILEFSCDPTRASVTAAENLDATKRRKKDHVSQLVGGARKIYDYKASGHQPENSNDDEEDDDDDDGEPGEKFKGMEKLAKEVQQEKDATDFSKERQIVAAYIDELFKVAKGCCRMPSSNPGNEQEATPISIGIAGSPNVGKSSLLNCLKGAKRVSVSSTAGHTKHLQTIPVEDEGCILIDSPGICFPLINIPRPLQSVFGIQQLAQTRDPQSGVMYLGYHLPLEKIYGLVKVEKDEVDWTTHELCEAFAIHKGFRLRKTGFPDVHRASLAILSEAAEGRLLLYFEPPTSTQRGSLDPAKHLLQIKMDGT